MFRRYIFVLIIHTFVFLNGALASEETSLKALLERLTRETH